MPKTTIHGRRVRYATVMEHAKSDRITEMQLHINPNVDLLPFFFEGTIIDRLKQQGVKLSRGTEVIHLTMESPLPRTDADELIESIIEQAISLQASREASRRRHPATTSKAAAEQNGGLVVSSPDRSPRSTVKRNPRRGKKS